MNVVLFEIRSLLATIGFTYSIPSRTSLSRSQNAVLEFLAAKTGGVRMQCASTALFRAVGLKLKLFVEVRTNKANASDASTGFVADLECVDQNGIIVLAVEVKDRQLELTHVLDKVPGIRSKRIREVLFLVRPEPAPGDAAEIDKRVNAEFSEGHNIYIVGFETFLTSCLILLGEEGRRDFLLAVGEEINRNGELQDRHAWKKIWDVA